jgi:transposase-like protein
VAVPEGSADAKGPESGQIRGPFRLPCRAEGPVCLAVCSQGAVALVWWFLVDDTGPVTPSSSSLSSAPAGYRFPREVIAVAVRWYLRYGLSYRDVEELLAERGVDVDHVSVYRWVQTFTLEFIDAARPSRHATGDRWFVDETYVKVAGRWIYLYRAVDQHGQVIDVLVATRRDAVAARTFFTGALKLGSSPLEVTTDRAPAYPRVIEELAPSARHVTERYEARRRPRGLSVGPCFSEPVAHSGDDSRGIYLSASPVKRSDRSVRHGY